MPNQQFVSSSGDFQDLLTRSIAAGSHFNRFYRDTREPIFWSNTVVELKTHPEVARSKVSKTDGSARRSIRKSTQNVIISKQFYLR